LLFFAVFSIFRVFDQSGIEHRFFLACFWGFSPNFQKMAVFSRKTQLGQQCKKIIEARLDPIPRHSSGRKPPKNTPKNEIVTPLVHKCTPNPPLSRYEVIFDPFFAVF
jgi:hypothetical protein